MGRDIKHTVFQWGRILGTELIVSTEKYHQLYFEQDPLMTREDFLKLCKANPIYPPTKLTRKDKKILYNK